MNHRAILLPALLTLCVGPGAGAQSGAPGPSAQAAIAAAIAHPDRPAADREADEHRRPDAVLALFDIRPGMRVLDMFASGGYYTELVARVVGSEGRVLAQNNAAYRQYAAEQIAARYADERLANVERLDVEVDELALPRGELDAVLLILSYHDLYYEPGDGSWPKIDGPRMLADFHAALKPGGVLGIVDHSAAPGGDTVEVATQLHRIDQALLQREVEAAGFVLDASSEVLRNPADELGKPMFAEGIRGRTDRFVLRYVKPRS